MEPRERSVPRHRCLVCHRWMVHHRRRGVCSVCHSMHVDVSRRIPRNVPVHGVGNIPCSEEPDSLRPQVARREERQRVCADDAHQRPRDCARPSRKACLAHSELRLPICPRALQPHTRRTHRRKPPFAPPLQARPRQRARPAEEIPPQGDARTKASAGRRGIGTQHMVPLRRK